MARNNKNNFVLPDLLRPGLRLVFCGTAAGTVSAERGAYYAHPQNKFWKALFESGLTSRLLAPEEFPRLLSYGIGLTDIGKHDFGMDHELRSGTLGREACAELRDKIEHFAPTALAFTSLRAGRSFLHGERHVGPQKEMIGATKLWILPSPSPAAVAHWNIAPWRDLAVWLKEQDPS